MNAAESPLIDLAGDSLRRVSVPETAIREIPIGGLIESIEIRPQEVWLVNTDCRFRYRLEVRLRDASGGEIPIDVSVNLRELRQTA